MSAALLEKILHETETLTIEEKEKLIDILSEQIYTPQEIDDAWFEELERRKRSAEAGQSGYVDWDNVKSKYEAFFEKSKTAHQSRKPGF